MKQLFFIFSIFALFQIPVPAQDNRIEEIRLIYQQTNKLIEKAERNFAEKKTYGNTEIFLTTMEINKKKTSYPAVGTYRKIIEFYYTYGDRSENPYPNRLLKISVVTYRAGWVESSEYYYDENENLVFHFSSPNTKRMDASGESRLYFSNGKPIRFLVGADDITGSNFRRKNAIVQEVLDEQESLKKIFKLSVKD